MRGRLARRAALGLGLALVLATSWALVACTGIDVPTRIDPGPEPVRDDPPEPRSNGGVPIWYGDSFDSSGCPIPRSGASIELTSDSTLLRGAVSDRGWCMYASTSVTTYYVIPPTVDPAFGAHVRESLEPLGWGFESPDDSSPQWSWVTQVPDSAAAAGFADGELDGTIYAQDVLTVDDIGSFSIWFRPLVDAFDQWQAGDAAYILAFW